ncbi:MAG: hypothetical protein QOD96_5874 [Pseudonocardiales bacterium]|jgi:hypothetical protein|nr:hypothetical protein [Pseudonocardiales bacterium]MDT7752212.1 hypothetical protein [Pseudonocardiales bacterium]
MNARAQQACVLSGLVLVVLFYLGFWVISGFLIPLPPNSSADVVAQMFARDRNRIRIGLLVTMFGAAMLVPWSAALFVQLRRGEGRFSPLPYVQMLCGTLFSLEFIYLIMFWQVAAFREDTPPRTIQTLYDMGWIPFVGLTSTAVVMALALGCSMLGDHHESPVYPRWAGYFNVWVAFMFTPGTLCVFFKDGPFAYNGVLAWYLPVAVFSIWLPLNTVLTLRAIKDQEREQLSGLGHEQLTLESLASELALVRGELRSGTHDAA